MSFALDASTAQESIDVATRVVDWSLDQGLQILVTIVLAVVARWVLHRIITRFVESTATRSSARLSDAPKKAGRVLAGAAGLATERREQRTRTMGSLLRSIVTIVVGVIAGLTVLQIIGIPLAPLLASAGVGGVALGFGAQSLVRDFLSGIFMILEDQYGVGDIVDTGEAVGTIEEVSLRITRLRDLNGVTWYVRNGEIIRIGNHSQGFASAVVDIPFSFKEDVDQVIRIITNVVHAMTDDEAWSGRLPEEPSVLGVESMSAGTMTVRVLATCVSGSQWELKREMRRRIKEAFDREGVKGPDIPPFSTTQV